MLRVPRGAPRPGDGQIREAIRADRRHLALSPGDGNGYQLVGPYPIIVAGAAIDEYVAWEL